MTRPRHRRHRRHWRVWRPRDLDWWVGAVLVPGALCFLFGPITPIAEAIGTTADLWVFVVGALFFTSSGTLQVIGALRQPDPAPHHPELWAAAVQLVGMLFFNVTTYAATLSGLSVEDQLHIVWRPDLLGSVCFLVSAVIVVVSVGAVHWPPHSRQRWTAAVNLLGCVFFMISAIAAYILPSGEVLRVTTANRMTSLGAACFLACALRAMADADHELGIETDRYEREERRAAWLEQHAEHRHQPT